MKETVTIYKDHYSELMDREFLKSSQLAYLQGTVKGLAGLTEQNPAFVLERIKDLAKKIDLGVDISAS